MSSLDDPRVLFAAERTLMAWIRTSSGLMALGFFIDRAAIMAGVATGRSVAMGIGAAFLILGVLLNLLGVVQYRRSIAELRPVEIPKNYWVNLSVTASLAVSVLGLLLTFYVFWMH